MRFIEKTMQGNLRGVGSVLVLHKGSHLNVLQSQLGSCSCCAGNEKFCILGN